MKQAKDLIKEVNIPSNKDYHSTAFEMFDEKEMFAILMEPEPGGGLLDKVMTVYQKETFMVKEIIE